jgi:hypothetical protein
MVDSKAGGVAVGGAQGTANAGASEFSGANFTYVQMDLASHNWTTDAGSTDGSLSNLVKWVSQKATVVAVNANGADGLVYMICEGPYGWGNSAALQASIRDTVANGGLGADGLLDSTPAAVDVTGIVTLVSDALTLGLT